MFPISLVDVPQYPLVILVEGFGPFVKKCLGHSEEDSVAASPVGNTPIETYATIWELHQENGRRVAYIPRSSLLGERLDDKLPILLAPSLHLRVR